ncbi:MAG: rhomboid family intramembrane serine protease [Alphaproteobacteria bacterium]|nr:rhomboid family intramembrane serine protease [Alphaproteobacteria bacterium]
MFLPIGDSNRLKRIPFQLTTASLVVASVIVYLYQIGLPHPQDIAFIFGYGVVPSVLIGDDSLAPAIDGAPAWATLVTYQFLHGGFWHLLGNMLFLWVFGDNVEDSMGHLKFLAFYILCGALAVGGHLVGVGEARQPLIGASGAVSGVIAAYLMLFPRGTVLILAFNWLPIRLPVWIVLGFWIGLQVFSYAMDADDGVAWLAHIGGLAAGAALLPLFKHKDVPLFQRAEAVAAGASRPPPHVGGSVPRSGPETARNDARGRRGPWSDG